MFKFPDGVDAHDFIRNYWQQKPLLFRQALTDCQSIISETELLQLATHEEVESRLIIEQSHQNYEVYDGPVTAQQLEQLASKTNWTILVQSVNLWNESVASLVKHINFIPNWRYDDIMISYSTSDGGVGPHTDHYDVFLMQISGSRRWRVGEKNQYQEKPISSSGLKLIEPFSTSSEHVLEVGDMLYIPPETPHEGISISSGMTLSIGFRSPSLTEFSMMLGEQFIENNSHYTDPCNTEIADVAEISHSAMAQAKHWYVANLDDRTCYSAFGKLQTQPKQDLLLLPIDEPSSAHINQGQTLYRDPAARIAWWQNEDSIYLFANGEEKVLSADAVELVKFLSTTQDIDLNMISAYIDGTNYEEVLMFLTDCGFYGLIE